MDFSSFLKNEISKKKEAAKAFSGSSKYVRKADIERQEQQNFMKEQEEIEHERLLKRQKEREERQAKEEENEVKRRKLQERLKLRDGTDSATEVKIDHLAEELNQLSDKELSERFRKYSEPIMYFGETRRDKIIRIKAIIERQNVIDQTRRDAKEELECDFRMVMNDIEESKNNLELKTKVLLQSRSYMKFLIQTWEDVVAKRTSDIDQTSTKANAVLKETKASLIPLLVLLRKGELSETVFPLLMSIFYYLQKKDFRAANDNYIKLSIGNAPWPIGVTAVGIHARSAREKITGENSEANIMKDDMTRSWLVAIKRLITFAEGHWSE